MSSAKASLPLFWLSLNAYWVISACWAIEHWCLFFLRWFSLRTYCLGVYCRREKNHWSYLPRHHISLIRYANGSHRSSLPRMCYIFGLLHAVLPNYRVTSYHAPQIISASVNLEGTESRCLQACGYASNLNVSICVVTLHEMSRSYISKIKPLYISAVNTF